MLGWINRLGGILLYITIYVLVFSVILFYAGQINLLQSATTGNSVSYPYIQPLGPKVIDGFASVVPVFKGMFTDLQNFFGGVAQSVEQNH